MPEERTLKEKAKFLENHLPCNCDLDNWQPEASTGHSWVCRIHKAAKNKGSIDPYSLMARWRTSKVETATRLAEVFRKYQEFCNA